MHAVLYVCLPRSKARTSLQARRKVCEYLTQEGFDTQLRFSGRCDYFSVGGRHSGRLALLRLRYEQPKQFDRLMKRYQMKSVDEAKAERLFREAFPDYRGKLPINRGSTGFEGEADDAQIMDESLFEQLKAGFSDMVDYSYEIKEPNVIFTDEPDDDFEWPKTAEEAARFWVVVIDYHF
jgi:hypothetical protein